jgi:hypothetical protein
MNNHNDELIVVKETILRVHQRIAYALGSTGGENPSESCCEA